jgi:hypothetical protein
MRLRFPSMRHRNVQYLGVILCVLFVASAALPAPPDASADEERLVRIPQAIQSGDLRVGRGQLVYVVHFVSGLRTECVYRLCQHSLTPTSQHDPRSACDKCGSNAEA